MLSPEEIGDRGESIYHSIKEKIAAEHRHKFLIIDVDSGDYEIDADDIAAEERLLARHPNAMMYVMRADGGPAWFLGSGLT